MCTMYICCSSQAILFAIPNQQKAYGALSLHVPIQMCNTVSHAFMSIVKWAGHSDLSFVSYILVLECGAMSSQSLVFEVSRHH